MFMVRGQLQSSQPHIILFLAQRHYFASVGMYFSDLIWINTKIVNVVIDDWLKLEKSKESLV